MPKNDAQLHDDHADSKNHPDSNHSDSQLPQPPSDISDSFILSPVVSSFKDSLTFRKTYDELDRGSILGGTCGEGHLLYEGILQHQILGSILAHTYPTLIDPNRLEDQIYVRASDFQRTILSATAQVTSYLKESLGYSYEKTMKEKNLLLHTRDMGLESLFPNLVSCPALLGLRERVMASNEYQTLGKRYVSLKERIQKALKLADLPGDITGNIYDCLMTTICSDQMSALPTGIRPSATYTVETAEGAVVQKSLLDETFDAVDDITNLEYTWKEGKFSRVAMVRFMCDFKAKILAGIRAELSTVYRGAELMTQLKKICNCNPQELLEYGEEKMKDVTNMEKLIFFLGHDTTILPFLASLGAFDGKWPPYASQVIMEVSKFGKNEFYFRIIYNGRLLNERVKGCDTPQPDSVLGPDLCAISNFFAATSWATPANTVSFCEVIDDNDKL